MLLVKSPTEVSGLVVEGSPRPPRHLAHHDVRIHELPPAETNQTHRQHIHLAHCRPPISPVFPGPHYPMPSACPPLSPAGHSEAVSSVRGRLKNARTLHLQDVAKLTSG